MSAAPRFSIIVPVFNGQDTLPRCVRSVLDQREPLGGFELILIDDCSTDGTLAFAQDLAARHRNVRVARTPTNGGPGIARNAGIEMAAGDWLIFLDCDDMLAPDALARLSAFIESPENVNCDCVGYNWAYADGPARRVDHEWLLQPRMELLRRYLSLQMDGSVIYTAVRARLIRKAGMRFEAGYHEDVDYLFKLYFHAEEIRYTDAPIYIKHQRPGSIVNTVTTRHLQGFFRAWMAIKCHLQSAVPTQWDDLAPFFTRGTSAVIATRLREIRYKAHTSEPASDLYRALYQQIREHCPNIAKAVLALPPTTYNRMSTFFIETMENLALSDRERAERIDDFIDSCKGKSWSCNDLQHSVFLAPGEIRTCCKRFFVDGEMRGDVVLIDLEQQGRQHVSPAEIAKAKHDLHRAINRGDRTACDGCPFLEYKEWEDLSNLSVAYLSLEYHSVCNLRCTYCSDTYYGGKRARYDVGSLVSEMIEGGFLSATPAIVWGGGEPTADRDFTPIATLLAEKFPSVRQRVLTNSVKHSPLVEKLLRGDKAVITTSLDAGTRETFNLIRGKDKLAQTLATIRRYAAAAPDNVTLKYIFTRGNTSIEECQKFAELVAQSGLLGCSFQISSDFKDERIDIDALQAMVLLYAKLTADGAEIVFFDDLIRHRLIGLDPATEKTLRDGLARYLPEPAIATTVELPEVVVWGAGWQAKYLMERSNLLVKTKVAFFADSTPSKIGQTFFGRPVLDPSAILESELPVLIAASQAYPAIVHAARRLGVPASRLLKKVII